MNRIAGILFTVLSAGCAVQPAANDALARVPADIRTESARQLVVTFRDARAGLRVSPGSSARLYGPASAYRGSPYAQRLIADLAREYEIDWVAGWRIDLLDVHCVVFRARDAAARDVLLARLKMDSRVESVQPMHTFTTTARTAEYNDPYFRLQKGIEAIRVPQAHRWSQGRGVAIAIIDTGVDLSHPELTGRVRIARNFVDNDGMRFLADRHGTAIAGVIAALTNNGAGIIGIAPAAHLVALKACWQERTDSTAVCSTLTLAEALAFAIEQRVRVINLSLTGPADPLLARLVTRAVELGILVVGASVSQTGAQGGFPLSVPGVIAVADADEVTPVGAAAGVATQALLAAPGREVLTLAPDKRYDYVSGASISAAMVSGVIALLLERQRGLAAGEVRILLERTAFVPAAGTLRLVNACDAVASVVRAPACGADAIHMVTHGNPTAATMAQ